MRFMLILLLSVGVFSAAGMGSAQAEEGGCPAHKAAEKGYTQVADFHHVIAPMWHNAYPAKDYDALIAAAPEISKAFAGIATMETKLEGEALDKFLALRETLATAIVDYERAAAAGDKDGVYALVPTVHNTFEEVSAALYGG